MSLFHLPFESGLLHPRVPGVRKFPQVHGLSFLCNGSILDPLWTLLAGVIRCTVNLPNLFLSLRAICDSPNLAQRLECLGYGWDS